MNLSGQFIVGVNLPWVNYGTDLGASAWYPEGGLAAQPAALARLERGLAALSRDGMTLVRVFLLCDGRSGIRYAGGRPAGLDEAFFPDLDALLDAARRHDVQIMPVLLDFHLCGRARVVNGVQTGGRAHLIADPGARAALLDRIFTPILEKYGDHGSIAAWDIINEPEWCLRRPWRVWQRGLTTRAVRQFLREAVACVRAHARQPVTVGSAGTWRLDLVKSLALDFYQVHWYPNAGWRALCRPVSELGLDAPVILGEFPGARGRFRVTDILGRARDAGYRGALVWSLLSRDEQSGYPGEVVEWARAHAADPGRATSA